MQTNNTFDNVHRLNAARTQIGRLLKTADHAKQMQILRATLRRHTSDNSSEILEITAQFKRAQGDKLHSDAAIELTRIRGHCLECLYEREDAISEYKDGIQLCQEAGDAANEAALNLLLAEVSLYGKNHDETFSCINNSIVIYTRLGDMHRLGECFGLLAAVYADATQTMIDLEYANKAITLLADCEDPEILRRVYYQLAKVHGTVQDITNAVAYHQKALDLNRAVGCLHDTFFSILSTAGLKGLVVSQKGHIYQLENLLAETETCLSIADAIKRPEFRTYIHMYKSRLYFRYQRYEDAIAQLQESLKHSKSGDMWDIVNGMLMREMGVAYLRLQRYSKAVDYLERALGILQPKAGDAAVLMVAYRLREAYQSCNDLQNARKMDVVLNGFKQRQLELQRTHKTFESDALTSRLLTIINSLRTENSNLQFNLAKKTREVVTGEMRIAHRNQILDDIERRIRRGLQASNKKYGALLRSLLIQISDAQQSDNEWSDSDQYFARLYPGFLESIQKRYPQLTPKELKLCAMLKLNMSTKEMAQLLSVSARTVETARYRLRKKIDAPRNISLNEHLMGTLSVGQA